jgi:branched-chain amino acid transport system substrate-binding protein
MKRAIFAGAMAAMVCGAANAEISGGVVRIGVLTDLSGPISSWAGQGSVIAAEMAAEDFVNKRFVSKHGRNPYKVEIVSADFQLKADTATAIARRWIAEGVDAIVDVPQPGAPLPSITW